MEANGQVRGMTALQAPPPSWGEIGLLSTEGQALWAPEPVWRLRRRGKTP
jgi:hypothetical protein